MAGGLDEYLGKLFDRRISGLEKSAGEIFKSTEGRGGFNVDRLYEVLTSHLPARYRSSRGCEIFDNQGGHSQAKDIVLFDGAKGQPLVFSESGSIVVPIDVCLAVVESKTTLTAVECERSCQQIAEVKGLKYIRTTIVSSESSGGSMCEVRRHTYPPIGIVVAYSSEWSTRETLEAHVVEDVLKVTDEERWDVLHVIDSAFLAATIPAKDMGENKRSVCTYQSLKADGVGPDRPAALLNFLLMIERRLAVREKAIPEIDYWKDYGLESWLHRMAAKTFDAGGTALPRSQS